VCVCVCVTVYVCINISSNNFCTKKIRKSKRHHKFSPFLVHKLLFYLVYNQALFFNLFILLFIFLSLSYFKMLLAEVWADGWAEGEGLGMDVRGE
jgi:hypothetical protein